MVNQLLHNDKISFVVSRNFTSRGKEYQIGDDFPQEDTNKIETFVRARYIIPVVDSIEDMRHIRHWHHHIRPKDEVLERLARDRIQLRMPQGQEPDSDEVVNLDVLTHPETTPEPDTTPSAEEPTPESDEVPEGTIAEVKAWVGDDTDRAARALEAEQNGQRRTTLITWLEDRVQ